ncbi:DMT family transporter [Paenarthrobacter nicotinovorans]|jgi:small multidrug resistance pump|uniref:DMT family transporter n=1 Tax=Paenarthrobacter nicotinovorans TaxID=29320 RepID=UPI00277E92B0|nr:multidrug efflux SMR transporter [Paenarthrobacter nicotinovorans]MDP9933901.1 small multidrug resistance pump [Paenarthrobacter nicotinovorans]
MAWLYLFLAIFTEVAATMSLRASEGLKKKLWAIPVVAGYASAFAFLSLTLAEGFPLGVAYGIWVACGVALTAVSARILFKEPLTPLMAAGMVSIGIGVLLVELGSHH